jgi:hypothetical protein
MIISTTQKCKGVDGKEVTAPSVRKHLKYEMKSILQFLNERRVDIISILIALYVTGRLCGRQRRQWQVCGRSQRSQ